MTSNPYSPPQASFPVNGAGFPEGVANAPIGWKLCYWLLIVGIAIDIGIVASCPLTVGSEFGLRTSMTVLSLISLAQMLMVFSIRWILFRMILRLRCPGNLRGVVPLVGVIVIFVMVKLIEYQGFRLWYGSGDLEKFLIFLIYSLALMVVMSPRRLAQVQARGPHFKS